MNREDLLFKILMSKGTVFFFTKEELREFINTIFDDFESRTCKNCKYFIKDKFVCCNSKAPTIVQINDDSFGCSKFERGEE